MSRVPIQVWSWWLLGLLRTRPWRLGGTVAGVAATIALLATLGIFLTDSERSMTAKAIAAVPVDWQVEFAPGTSVETVQDALAQVTPNARQEQIGYASVDGFEATTADTVQTTGSGKVLGVGPSYTATFGGQLRFLQGVLGGSLVSQQTASNLHVGVGDKVVIHRPGLPDVSVAVTGVVDLPNADALFQAIGVPAGAAPQAPPDNVLILPIDRWRELFSAQMAARPDTIRWQIHASLDHDLLPSNPTEAYKSVSTLGRNLELRLTGRALLANNIAARLDAARSDALYARVLFLFLGAPGVILAGLLTIATAMSGEQLRKREQAILRMRGASLATVTGFAAIEAGAVWVGGTILGILVTIGFCVFALKVSPWQLSTIAILVPASAVGLLLAFAAVLFPAWHQARNQSVANARQSMASSGRPIWQRIHLDIVLLVLAILAFWRTAQTGYQLVLATEGVAAISVDYWSFLAPLLLWLGLGFLTVRAVTALVVDGRGFIGWLVKPFAGTLAHSIAASLSRQHRRLAIGVGLTALAFAFAASTSIFNTTYQAQALIDAQLTNGADVAIRGDAASPASKALPKITSLPGVAAIEPMQHRFAYVGTDLQDLYGIDTAHIGEATPMSDAYFAAGNARQTLNLLGRTPDGVLVSEETVSDFQLALGDKLNLRIKHAGTNEFVTVPFTLIGVVREFPTAPHDSFLVANAHYIASVTGSDASEFVLVKAAADPAVLAAKIASVLADQAGLAVSDVGQAQHLIGSSLTAVNLSGLTRLELGFALVAIVGATGLVLALGLADRRRSFAILTLLGARPSQTTAFLWSEGLLVFGLGATIGLTAGTAIAWMLVTVLQGAFDPPPEVLSAPVGYLASTLGIAAISMLIAIEVARRDAASYPNLTIKEMR